MKLPFLCKNPKTISFRADKEMFKMVNSVFHNTEITPDQSSWFTNSSESTTESFSTDSDGDMDEESIENVVHGAVRSEKRLVFECKGESSSILEESKKGDGENVVSMLKDSVVVAMESEDPYGDFRTSMEEMVRSNGGSMMKDWDCLEEMLSWYLRMNGKRSHGVIIAAFVDLLVSVERRHDDSGSGLVSGSSSSTTCYSSVVSSFPSSPVCSSQSLYEIDEEKDDV